MLRASSPTHKIRLPHLLDWQKHFRYVKAHTCKSILTQNMQKSYSPSGFHIHGLWTSSLESDLGWWVLSREMTHGRLQTAPSWSWLASVRGDLSFRTWGGEQYHRLHKIVEAETRGVITRPTCLLLSGIVLMISLQQFLLEEDSKNHYPLYQKCWIVEQRERQHKAHVIGKDEGKVQVSSLSDSLEGGCSDAADQWLQGTFHADHKFWSSEDSLENELQQLFFVIFCKDSKGDWRDNFRGRSTISGLVLRSVNDRYAGFRHADMDHFERIGWLSYNPWVILKDYVPPGIKKKFILV
jgi:hypothetical protein